MKAGPGTFNTGWAGLFYQIDGNVIGYSSVTGSAGGWYLMNIKVPASALTSGTTLRVGCFNNHSATDIYFDDFRFQPINSVTTAYVYDQFTGELTHILDNNNLYSKFEYDGHGRLIKTYRETFAAGAFKTNEYEYNYCQSGTLFTSAGIDNHPFTPQCPQGQVGTPYYVTVPAGQFSSGVSQADADLQAQQYAQQQADLYGTCTTQIYAKLFYENQWGSGAYADIVIRFYSDYACTMPYSVSNLEVNVYDDVYCDLQGYDHGFSATYQFTCNGTETTILSSALLIEPYYEFGVYAYHYHTYYLLSGNGYVPVN